MGRGARTAFTTWWANASYRSVAKPAFQETSDDQDESGLPLRNYPTTASREPCPAFSRRQDDRRVPSDKFTLRQVLYIAGSHGVGALTISGGINFAIAYAMYTTTDDQIRLFQLPNTLVGDTVVTIIAQCIITWLIEMMLVNRDLRKGNVQPIGFVAEPSPSTLLGRSARWFMLLDLPKQQRKRRESIRRKVVYLYAQVLRAFLLSVVYVCILLGPSIGILIAVGSKNGAGGDWVFSSRWAPEIFKLVLGSILAVMTSPFFAMYWMVKCGWNGCIHEAVMINGNDNK